MPSLLDWFLVLVLVSFVTGIVLAKKSKEEFQVKVELKNTDTWTHSRRIARHSRGILFKCIFEFITSMLLCNIQYYY